VIISPLKRTWPFIWTIYNSLYPRIIYAKFDCLFVCLKPHEQFFSYLAAVTITGDRAANFGLCSVLRA
jgi:hypothetical protein